MKAIKRISNMYTGLTLKLSHKGLHKSVKFREPEFIKLGNSCTIGENSYLYCWRTYKYKDIIQQVHGSITIGDNFRATRNLTIQACGDLRIGDNVLIASNVFICDYNHGTDDVEDSYLNNELTLSPVEICDGVWIGQGVYILPGVTIGRNSIIGAGSVVTKSIPEYCIAVGNPAKVIKCYNSEEKCWSTAERYNIDGEGIKRV